MNVLAATGSGENGSGERQERLLQLRRIYLRIFAPGEALPEPAGDEADPALSSALLRRVPGFPAADSRSR